MQVSPTSAAAHQGSNRTAIVVGAGIAGVCCALAMQRRGIQVTLLERDEPGEACSFGNAARVAAGSVAPRATPGLLRQVPGMLADPSHPLKIRPGHLLRSAGWFWRFFRAARPERVRAIADGMHALCDRADDAFDELVAEAGARGVVRREGFLYAYADPGKFASARATVRYATDRGITFDELTPDEARELEPGLPRKLAGAFYRPNEALVTDPLQLTRRFVEAFVQRGGKIVKGEARAIREDQDGAAVITDAASLRADNVIIAAGAWSPKLAATVGINLPIQAERGYHAEVADPGIELKLPVSLGDRHVSLSPLDGRLRIASGAQFAPVDEAPDWRRLDRLLESARSYYPELRLEGHTRWMGARPTTPDSVPVIGLSRRHPQIGFACGHGMLGLTLAAVTARLVADQLGQAEPELDLSPYSPDRFA